MRGTTAFIGFLIVQIIVVALWVAQLTPVLSAGTPLVSPDAHIFSGAIYASPATNFRMGGETGFAAHPFKYDEYLLWAALLIVLSGGSAWLAGWAFRTSRIWVSVALVAATLGLAIGGGYYIVEQWAGDTMFPPGSVNELVLYAATKAFLWQLGIGWVVLAAYAVLSIAGLATAGKPLGYHLGVLNWLIVVLAWLVVFVGLFVVPSLTSAAAPPT
jgi:hypothetical protein